MTDDLGPTRFNLQFMRGETWSLAVTCKTKQGAVIDLTGAISAAWRVASVTEGGELNQLVVEADIDDGIEIDALPTTGKLYIAVTPAMQANVTAGAYRHELQIVTSDGLISTQMIGSLHVEESLFSAFA